MLGTFVKAEPLARARRVQNYVCDFPDHDKFNREAPRLPSIKVNVTFHFPLDRQAKNYAKNRVAQSLLRYGSHDSKTENVKSLEELNSQLAGFPFIATLRSRVRCAG